MGFSTREHWSGVSCPPRGDLPHSGTESASPCLLHWQQGSLLMGPPGKPQFNHVCVCVCVCLIDRNLSQRRQFVFLVGVSELDIFCLIFENPGGKEVRQALFFFIFVLILIFFPFPLAFFLFRKMIWPLISFPCSESFCFDAVSLILRFHYEKGTNRIVRRGGRPCPSRGCAPQTASRRTTWTPTRYKTTGDLAGCALPTVGPILLPQKAGGLLSTSTPFHFKAGLCQTHVAEPPAHPVFSR